MITENEKRFGQIWSDQNYSKLIRSPNYSLWFLKITLLARSLHPTMNVSCISQHAQTTDLHMFCTSSWRTTRRACLKFCTSSWPPAVELVNPFNVLYLCHLPPFFSPSAGLFCFLTCDLSSCTNIAIDYSSVRQWIGNVNCSRVRNVTNACIM
jgi:hypothetical protein